jgi:GT2 family glycosyltransferase
VSSRLSIVIPCHNRPDLLRLCLASVHQHAPPETEILVVDDGSEGGVVTRLAHAQATRVLSFPHQQGFCVAVNAGVRSATGEFVELLNDDTEVTANWAEAALARFDDPSVAAVTPLVLQGPPGANDPPRIDSTGDEYHAFGIARKRGHGSALRAEHLVAGPVFAASGSSSFFRREAFLAVGGLPEEFGAYFDDIDLSFRLRRAGHAIFYEPASCVYHRVSSSHGPPRGALLTRQSRNEELVYWRNVPSCQLISSLPGHLAVLAAKALLRWQEGQLVPWLRGRCNAWRSLPEVFQQRRLWTATPDNGYDGQ